MSSFFDPPCNLASVCRVALELLRLCDCGMDLGDGLMALARGARSGC